MRRGKSVAQKNYERMTKLLNELNQLVENPPKELFDQIIHYEKQVIPRVGCLKFCS